MNLVACGFCGFTGYIVEPFAFVSLSEERVVVVEAVETTRGESHELLSSYLETISPDLAARLHLRVQTVPSYEHIPAALAVPAADVSAEAEARGRAWTRAHLPIAERIAALIADAAEHGTVSLLPSEHDETFIELLAASCHAIEKEETRRGAAARSILGGITSLSADSVIRSTETGPTVAEISAALQQSSLQTTRGLELFRSLHYKPDSLGYADTPDRPAPPLPAVIGGRRGHLPVRGNELAFPEHVAQGLQLLDRGDYGGAREVGTFLASTGGGGAISMYGVALVAMTDLMQNKPEGLLSANQVFNSVESQLAIDGALTPLDALLLGHVSRAAGDWRFAAGDLTEARSLYLQAFDSYYSISLLSALHGMSLRLAKLELVNGDPTSAREVLEWALMLAADLGVSSVVHTRLLLAPVIASVTGPPEIVLAITVSDSALVGSNNQSTTDGRFDSDSFSSAIFQVFYGANSTEPVAEVAYGDPAVGQVVLALKDARAEADADLEIAALSALAGIYHGHRVIRATRMALQLVIERCVAAGRSTPTSVLPIAAEHLSADGEASWDAGDLDAAARCWAHGLTLARAAVAGQVGVNAPDPREEMGLRSLEGLLAERTGLHDHADEAYRAAVSAAERWRSYSVGDESRMELQRRASLVFVRAARNALAGSVGGQPRSVATALAYVEAARSRTFLERALGISSARHSVVWTQVAKEMSNDLAVGTQLLELAILPTGPGTPGSWAALRAQKSGISISYVADMEGCLQLVERLRELDHRIASRLGALVRRGSSLDNDREVASLLSEWGMQIPALDALLLSNESAQAPPRELIIVPEAYLFDVPFAGHLLRVGERRAPALERLILVPSATFYLRRPPNTSVAGHGCALFFDPLGDLRLSQHEATVSVALQRFAQVSSGSTGQQFLESLTTHKTVIFVGHCVGRSGDNALIFRDGPLPLAALEAWLASTRATASTVYLLGCSTGVEDFNTDWSAREVRGFSSVLLAGGVEAVISASRPLWTPVVMHLLTSICASLGHGYDPARALVAAQRALANAGLFWSHPCFWGSTHFSGGGTA
ncbi:MAG: CHAT domain-containing protein [Actinomycetota bacterium]|nr:CHAT domain-containing protein [Actinomycetota bacterium]